LKGIGPEEGGGILKEKKRTGPLFETEKIRNEIKGERVGGIRTPGEGQPEERPRTRRKRSQATICGKQKSQKKGGRRTK